MAQREQRHALFDPDRLGRFVEQAGTIACGPKRQFAAVQQCGRCRWNTGRSVDAADTAADP